jgi:hypothetical protein
MSIQSLKAHMETLFSKLQGIQLLLGRSYQTQTLQTYSIGKTRQSGCLLPISEL